MTGVAAANPRQQFFDSSGKPLVGGFVDVYLAGTTTRTDTWRERTLTEGNKNDNPIELDSRGECALWLDENVTYKLVLKNSDGVVQYTADNVVGAAGIHILADVTAAKDGALSDIATDRAAALAAVAAQQTTSVAAVETQQTTSVDAVAAAQATAEAAVDALVTDAEAAQATAVAKATEAANYAAAAATGAKFFDTIALGNAGVADGASFGVKAGGSDGLTRPTVYRRDSAGTQTLLYAVVPGTEFDTKVIDNRSLAAGDAYSTAPATVGETVASATPTSVGTATIKGVALNAGHPATMAGVARSFSAKFGTALAGRKVEFYVFTPAGGGWVCTYASGLQDASASGVNTFAVPVPGNVRVGVGDIVGAYTDAAANADGFFLATSGGNTIGPTVANASGTRISLGGNVTSGAGGYTSDNSRYYGISITTAHEAILVPARWANLANGFAKLDTAARLPSSILPANLAENAARSATAGVVATEFDVSLGASKTVSRPDTATSSLDYASVTGSIDTTNTYPQNRVVVCWVNGSPGFTKAGVLTKLRIPPGGTRAGGAKIQAWVVRPTAALGAIGSTATFTKVATIGEIDATDTAKHCEFAGLSIPVAAGDLIALRGINAGLRFGSGAAEYTNSYFIDPNTIADMTLAGMDGGVSGTVQATRKFDMYAEVAPGPFVATDTGPNATVRLDSSGRIPAVITRSADAPWAGLKIAAVGTSIPAMANSYIYRLAQMLQCQIDNQAVGSSGIVWDGTRALSLGATQAELTAAGFSSAQSYEVKVLGQAADLFIFDHGYNDRTYSIGTINDATAATFYGAYNKVIGALLAERPSQRFMLITPHSVYAPTNEGYHASTENIRQAMLALAAKYQCPILDWTYKMQLSASQAATFLTDTVHPNDTWHAMAARVLYRFILDNA